MTYLLHAARQYGMTLVTKTAFVDEVVTHLQNALMTYNNYQEMRYRDEVQEIVAVYFTRQSTTESFSEFVSRFIGDRDPRRDLADFLCHELEISIDDEERHVDEEELADRERLISGWIAAIDDQRGARMDPDKQRLLAEHDVDAILAIDRRRRADSGNRDYGHRWWWLTLDRRAFRLEASLRQEATSACMSPDYLVRYLSVKPMRRGSRSSLRDSLPLAVEIVNLELLAAQYCRRAVTVLAKMHAAPAYRRRRVIRDLHDEERSRQRGQEALTKVLGEKQ